MRFLTACLVAFALACGGGGGKNTDGGVDPTGDGGGDPTGDGGANGDGGGGTGDGGGGTGDGGVVPGGCTGPVAGAPQCSNCIDDDNDGRIDGFDIECTGAADNDESSFSTGIPGDNIDAIKQDCFFDGNSGAGDDGCEIHVCCLLGATTVQQCTIGQQQYDPMDCPPPIGTTPLSQQCMDTCGPLTPPGCDCFGCCTLCDPQTNECFDIATNPATSPDCDENSISDPTKCKRCTKVTSCGGGECGGMTCILCPGQDPNDLPAECNGTNQCPDMQQSCTDAPCAEGSYCSNGCCIGIIL